MDTALVQLHDRLAALEQENAMLRSRLQSCERSHAVLQAEIAIYRQDNPDQLNKHNQRTLERCLLEAIATVANTLLSVEDFDTAVDTALQVLGKALEADRLLVTENFVPQSGFTFPHWRLLYEWDSPGTVSQMAYPDLTRGSWEGIEEWYERLSEGQSVTCPLEDTPEPFQELLVRMGVKEVHSVPIFVEGKYWGQLAFDDCCETKCRSVVELSVLRVAANCIGSAIQKQRTQQALLEVEQTRTRSAAERSQELERHNAELQQTLDRLAESEKRYRTLFELSNEGISRFEFEQPIPIALPIEEQLDLTLQHYRYVEANEPFCDQIGVSIDQLRTFTLSDFHGNLEANREVNRSILANGYRVRNAETEEIDALGRRKYFLNNVVCEVRDGYLWGGWCTQTDITELRETQQALLEAEQARVAELAKTNQALKNSLDRFAANPDLNAFLGHVLLEIVQQFEIELGYLWLYDATSQTLPLQLYVREGQVRLQDEFEDVLLDFRQPSIADLPIWDTLLQTRQPFVITRENAAQYLVRGTYDCQHQKHQTGINLLLTLKDEPIGLLSLVSTRRSFSPEELELAQALAHQATLALQLTRLAEEAKQAAIAREQEKAAQERAAELAKANQALKRSLDTLATEPSLDNFLGQVLKVVAEQLDAPLTEYWYHPEPYNIAYVGLIYWQGQILRPAEQPGHVGAFGYPVPPEMIHQESLHHRRSHFITDDIATSEIHIQIAHESGLDAGAWYEQYGVSRFLNVPLILGDKTIGALIIFLPSNRHFTEQQIELTYALAQQVTLAIQLTRLAEEAKQAAIAREQKKAAQERAIKLAQANQVLRASAESLTSAGDLDAFLGTVLLEITKLLQVRSATVWLCGETKELLYLKFIVEEGIIIPAAHSNHPNALTPNLLTPDSNSAILQAAKARPVLQPLEDIEELTEAQRQHLRAQGVKAMLAIVMTLHDECIGSFGVRVEDNRTFLEEELEMVQALANQATLAVHLTQLAEQAKQAAIAREQEKAAQERAAELAKANEALKRSLTLLAEEPALDKFLGYVLQATADQLGDRSGAVYLYSESDHTTLMHLNYEDGHLQQGDRITHPAATLPCPPQAWDNQYLPLLRQNQILIHHAVEFDSSAYAPYCQHNRDRDIQTLLIVPLLFGDQLLGSLTLRSTQHRDYTPEDLELARALAQQATLAVQLTQLAEQGRQQAIIREQEKAAQAQVAELAKANEALRRSIAHLTSADHLQSFLLSALQEAIQASSGVSGAVFVYEPTSDTLQMIVLVLHGQIVDIATDSRAEIWRAAVPTTITSAWQMMTRERQIIWSNLDQPLTEDWHFAIPWHQQLGHRTIAMIPLLIGEQPLGFMGLAFTTDQPPSQSQLEQCRTFAQHTALALQLADLIQQIKQTALLEERNRMAREIHDTLAQVFTGVIMQLEATKRKINLTQLEAAQDHIATARTLATEGLSEARRSVRALRPEALESQNLAAALHCLVQQMTLGTPLQASFRTEGTPHPLPSEVESHLLRIGQEALTNTLKHAQAQTVRLELLFEPTAVHLRISDDGQGFEPQSLVTQGFGLIGMQERSQQLGGQFTLVSSPGAGTEIRVSVPI